MFTLCSQFHPPQYLYFSSKIHSLRGKHLPDHEMPAEDGSCQSTGQNLKEERSQVTWEEKEEAGQTELL